MATGSTGAGADEPRAPGPEAGGEPDESSPGVGEVLRRRRTERGITLSDAERDTRINRTYLQALEAERWDALPAPVYTRGFLRSYGRHLELDAGELVSMLPAELPRPRGLEPLPGLRRRHASLALDVPRVLLVTLAAVAAIAVAVAAIQFRAAGGEGEGTPAESAQTATPTATPDADATVPPAEPGTTPDFSGVTLETARETLEELGLLFNVIEIATDSAPPGVVFGQSPAAGEPVASGDPITLIVSSGTP